MGSPLETWGGDCAYGRGWLFEALASEIITGKDKIEGGRVVRDECFFGVSSCGRLAVGLEFSGAWFKENYRLLNFTE